MRHEPDWRTGRCSCGVSFTSSFAMTRIALETDFADHLQEVAACDCGHGEDRHYELDDVTGRSPCIENGCPCSNFVPAAAPAAPLPGTEGNE